MNSTILDIWHRVVASGILRALVLSALRELARRSPNPQEGDMIVTFVESAWNPTATVTPITPPNPGA